MAFLKEEWNKADYDNHHHEPVVKYTYLAIIFGNFNYIKYFLSQHSNLILNYKSGKDIYPCSSYILCQYRAGCQLHIPGVLNALRDNLVTKVLGILCTVCRQWKSRLFNMFLCATIRICNVYEFSKVVMPKMCWLR